MVCIVPNKHVLNRTVYKNKFFTIVEKYRKNGIRISAAGNQAARYSFRVVYFYKLPIFAYNKLVQIL